VPDRVGGQFMSRQYHILGAVLRHARLDRISSAIVACQAGWTGHLGSLTTPIPPVLRQLSEQAASRRTPRAPSVSPCTVRSWPASCSGARTFSVRWPGKPAHDRARALLGPPGPWPRPSAARGRRGPVRLSPGQGL